MQIVPCLKLLEKNRFGKFKQSAANGSAPLRHRSGAMTQVRTPLHCMLQCNATNVIKITGNNKPRNCIALRRLIRGLVPLLVEAIGGRVSSPAWISFPASPVQ